MARLELVKHRMHPTRRGPTISPTNRGARVAAVVCVLVLAHGACRASDTPGGEAISFRQAVDLALQHSGVMAIASINQWRAEKVYQETRSNYIPQLSVGSGLGYSYGFPLTIEGTPPAVANFNSVQTLYSPSLKQFVKAAKIDWQSTSMDVRDKRDAVILDTALTYAQLDQLLAKIKTLTEAQAAADKAEFVTEQRLREGVGSQLDVTRSQLMAARIRLRIAQSQGQTDVLREHLSRLLGIPAESIKLEPDSMPPLPTVAQDADLPALAVQNSPAVKVAEEKAAAAEARAKGEHKALLPSIDAASQYAYLARYNNYDQYYRKYSANNFSGGLNIRIPVFNSVQKNKAAEADADAMTARKQAEMTKNQVSEDTLKLQRSLRELAAGRDVAKLEWQVSQGDLEAVKARMATGNANTRDEQNARLDVNDKYAAYLDAQFDLNQAELRLLRLTGELEDWAIPPH